jgi:hypothetical protein
LPLGGLWWGSGREDLEVASIGLAAAAAADDEIDERIFWVAAKML